MRNTFCMLFSLLYLAVFAQEDKWTPEEIINTVYVGGPELSEDGNKVVWNQRKGVTKEDKFVRNLYLARLDMLKDDKPTVIQLTQSASSESNYFFSKDGETLFFKSSREKGKSLWKLNLLGGEAEEVHTFENGFSSVRLLDDNTLLFIAGEGKTLYDIKYEKDNTTIVEDTAHWEPKRIFSFDLKAKKITRITANRYQISGYDISKDGKYLIYTEVTSPDYAADANPKPNYVLVDLNGGDTTRLLAELQSPGGFKFTDDGTGFYFSATLSSDPEWNGAGIRELYYYDLSAGDYTKVPLDWENGLSGEYFLNGSDILVQLANGPLKKVRYYQKSGEKWKWKDFELEEKTQHVDFLAFNDPSDQLIYRHSTASQLPAYHYATIRVKGKSVKLEEERVLTSLNDNLKKKPVAKSEIIYWTGANDEEVNGILYYPKDYEEGKQYPLVISIHGGPTGTDRDSWSERWSTYPQIFTDKGAFVLKPNYHGSGDHNLEFIESIKNGKYYQLEQIDIFNGLKFLEGKGYVDIDKVGLMGWSNGAILTTWMTLQYPDMFKVAAPGAGDINWTSDYGTCRFGVSFDQSYFGGAPWDDTNGKHYNEWYIKYSPIFDIEKIKTPTIIFHGSEDRAVPRDQGWEYYRGLQQVGKAPVKFLWFPGQPHGLRKITHQLRKMKEEIDWFDTYLFGEEEKENEAFKEDSPLAAVLAQQKSTSKDGLLGTLVDDTLIPATVSTGDDSISIGVYEVTVAQYHAYTSEDYDRLHANKPVTGLSEEQITKYLGWLTEETGETYRLPNKKEAEKLHKLARKQFKAQNNLNYWAGYELKKPDVNDLRNKLSELKYPLVKDAGSHPWINVKKDVYLYDLGGNVAEYYTNDDKPGTYDYSAYDFVDPVDENNDPVDENTGFRVIKE